MTDEDRSAASVPMKLDATHLAIAEENTRAQTRLLEELIGARKRANRSREDVANLLRTTSEMVRDIEEGAYDLTFSELRRYAFAVDALVTYGVRSNAQAVFASHASTVDEIVSRSWRSTGWSADQSELLAALLTKP